MSQTKVEAPFVEGGGGGGFKNLLINGNMKVSQRSSEKTSHSADSYVTIDRWKTRVNNQGVFTVSKSTTVPTGEGFTNSQKWDCTTADASPASTDYIIFQQAIEASSLQHLAYGTSGAKSTTLSFWVRSNKTGAYTVGLYAEDDARHIESSYTISSADTWEKKKITFAGDTTGVIDNNNGEGLRLWFWLGAGSNFSSGTHATSWASYSQANVLVDNQVNIADSTDNEWYITGVQFEVGDDASDFEHLPHDVNLRRCYRYYQKTGGNAGDQVIIPTTYTVVANSTTLYGGCSVFVPMRSTIGLSSDGLEVIYMASSTTNVGAIGAFDNVLGHTDEFHGCSFSTSASSGTPFTAGYSYGLRTRIGASYYVAQDAEL